MLKANRRKLWSRDPLAMKKHLQMIRLQQTKIKNRLQELMMMDPQKTKKHLKKNRVKTRVKELRTLIILF